MVKIDLHTHSTRSDGLDTPSQLVTNAAKAGINVLHLPITTPSQAGMKLDPKL